MKIYFLGTNGWFDSETGETLCTLIDSKEAYVILDAGNSFRKIDKYIKDNEKPIYLLLSHFHIDHISGLHTLIKFKFPQGLTILGQPGTTKVLAQFLNKPFTVSVSALNKKYPVQVRDLAEGHNQIPIGKGNLELVALPLVHADPCFGYSFVLEGKKISYCTDTGICDNFLTLAKDADLLISECSWKESRKSDWPHLAPEDAATAAKNANVKRLILTHFDAATYLTLKERKDAEASARAIFKNTIAAKDGLGIDL